MDNPNICINCETLNTPESIFCKHCGKPLPGKTIDPALDAEIDSLVKAKKEQLSSFAESLENKIELNSIKKIDGWIRNGGILGAVLAFLGVASAGGILTYTVNQTKAQADMAKNGINEQLKGVQKEFEHMQDEMKNFEDIKANVYHRISELAKQVDEAKKSNELAQTSSRDAKKASEDVQNIKDKTIRDVAAVHKELDKQKTDLINKIQQTENGTFDVFIDLDGDLGSKSLKGAMDTLQNNGFRISGNNVMGNVEVIQNEIEYFSRSGKDKAKEIIGILKPFYKDIQLNFKKNSDRGASDLLLKLKDRM